MRESWERPMRLRAANAFVVFLAAVAVLKLLSCTPPARPPIHDLALTPCDGGAKAITVDGRTIFVDD